MGASISKGSSNADAIRQLYGIRDGMRRTSAARLTPAQHTTSAARLTPARHTMARYPTTRRHSATRQHAPRQRASRAGMTLNGTASDSTQCGGTRPGGTVRNGIQHACTRHGGMSNHMAHSIRRDRMQRVCDERLVTPSPCAPIAAKIGEAACTVRRAGDWQPAPSA